MNYKRKIYTTIVGRTSSDKAIRIPLNEEDVLKFVEQIFASFNHDEVFEMYAVVQYLISKKMNNEQHTSEFFEILQKVSTNVSIFLETSKLVDIAMERAGVKNIIDILNLGKRLVLQEFKRI